MSAYNSEFLALKREEWKNSLGEWQWYENSAWHKATVNSITVDGEYIIAMIYCPNSGATGTISGLRVYSTRGQLAAHWNVSIVRSSVQNALFRVKLPIKEV
ncbi:MAG: hypothetical protein LUD12_10130 [Lachnospiraceae bacterium]|nr:hypothetical protein [Lachnospiraceae bacterium]